MSTPIDYADKISKLLTKAEGTNSDAEAETFREKAYELMIRYSIDQAEIDARRAGRGEVREQIIKESVFLPSSYRNGLLQMVHHIVSNIETLRGYVSKNLRLVDPETGKRVRGHVYYVVGFESDVKQAVVLVTSLQLQMAAALTQWWQSDEALFLRLSETGMEKFKARREFMICFGIGAEKKLADARRVVTSQSTGTALMLLDRGSQVDTFLEDLKLRSTKSRMARGSYAAEAAGFRAGQRANTGESGIGGSRAALR